MIKGIQLSFLTLDKFYTIVGGNGNSEPEHNKKINGLVEKYYKED